MTTSPRPRLDLSDLEDHTLVAVDRRGQHCSCGVIADWREHMAALTLEAVNAPPAIGTEHTTRAGINYAVSADEDLAIRHLLITPDVAACRTLLRYAPAAHRRGIARRLQTYGLGWLHDRADAAERRSAARTARRTITTALAEEAAAS